MQFVSVDCYTANKKEFSYPSQVHHVNVQSFYHNLRALFKLQKKGKKSREFDVCEVV